MDHSPFGFGTHTQHDERHLDETTGTEPGGVIPGNGGTIHESAKMDEVNAIDVLAAMLALASKGVGKS